MFLSIYGTDNYKTIKCRGRERERKKTNDMEKNCFTLLLQLWLDELTIFTYIIYTRHCRFN